VYPDTNIFMHYRSVDELPLANIVGALGAITVVVTPSVVDELDMQKVKHPNSDLRERAKQVVARLREWRRSGRTTLPNGAQLAYRVQRHAKDLRALGLDETIRDDHLLAEILSERDVNKGRHVLLTADFGPELRAESLQIEAVAPPEEHRLALPDATEKELRKAKAEIQRMQTRRPNLVLGFADGGPHRSTVRRPAPLTDVDLRAKVEQERRARIMALPIELSRTGVVGTLASFSSNPLGPSVGAVRAYNEGVEKYLAKYEEHLRRWWLADEELVARTIELSLEFCNQGTVTASTVRIEISAPPDVELTQDSPAGHALPQPPERPRSLYDGGPMLPDSLLRGYQAQVQPNVRGPYLTKDEDPAVTYRIDRALHKQTYTLKPFFLVYPTIEAIRSVTLRASMVSDELPDWSDSELHVVVDFDDSSAEVPPVPEPSES